MLQVTPIVDTTMNQLSFQTWLELKPQIQIDRDFLQRVLEHWSDNQVKTYLNGVFRGHKNIDAFVIVSIDEILRVLNSELSRITRSKELEDDKSEVQNFIDRMENYKSNDKEWMLINGQHRDDGLERWWEGSIPCPSDFSKNISILQEDGTPLSSNDIDGKLFPKLSSEIQEAFFRSEHPVVTVMEFDDMEDLADIVRFHNTGNDWNENEWRAISPSYIMQKFSEMNRYPDFKKIFATVSNRDDRYHLARKGVCCFLTHQYYAWHNRSKSNWTEIPGWKDSKFDEMAKISSDIWSPKSVDSFLAFAKKVAKEYVSLVDTVFKKAKGKGSVKVGVTNSIATFRNYFHFRMILDTPHHSMLSEVYKVKNGREFAATWLISESIRQSTYENLSDEGKRLYDEYKAGKDPLGKGKFTDKVIKYLKDSYHKTGIAYTADLKTAYNGEQLQRVMKAQLDDFVFGYDGLYAKGYVKKQGAKANATVAREVYSDTVRSVPTMTIDDFANLVDSKKNHIGHQIARQNAGDYDVGNLKIEDAEYNLSNKENRSE
jgi:hypothetical protein